MLEIIGIWLIWVKCMSTRSNPKIRVSLSIYMKYCRAVLWSRSGLSLNAAGIRRPSCTLCALLPMTSTTLAGAISLLVLPMIMALRLLVLRLMMIEHILWVIFLLIPLQFRTRPHKLGPGRDQVTAQVLNFCQEPRKSSEIMELIGLKHWKTFQANYLKPLLQQGLLAMTIPAKPTSSKQRYIMTEAGNEALKTENGANIPNSKPIRKKLRELGGLAHERELSRV